MKLLWDMFLPLDLGQNPARQASIKAGIPVSKPAHIINQVCGSGLRSSGFRLSIY